MANIVSIFSSRRIETSNFGVFIIRSVLIDYEYPRCFVASRDGDYFAFIECEDNDDLYGWTVAEVTLPQINDVNLGKKNIQSLFPREKCFEVLYYGNEMSAVKTDASPIEEKHVVSGNLYAKGFCDMDESFDYHSLQKDAKRDRNNSVSLIYEGDILATTGLVFRAINYLKDMFRNVKCPLDIMKSSFSTQRASTVVTFTFENDLTDPDLSTVPNLEPPFSDSLRQFGNIMSSDDPLELINETSNPSKFLSKYKNMLRTVNGEKNLQPKVVVASSSFEKAKSFALGPEAKNEKGALFSEAEKLIKDKTVVEEKTDDYQGVLEGIFPSKNGRFIFQSINPTADLFDGRVDVSLLDKIHSFIVKGAIYDARIKTITAFRDGKLQKESYVLLELSFVRNIEQHEQLSFISNDPKVGA